jgi:adenylate cyclase
VPATEGATRPKKRLRFPLRGKVFLFAVLIAITPLVLVGQNLVRITQDELKSAANEQLADAADQLRESLDDSYQGNWLTPLLLIRNGIDSEKLAVPEKVSLMTLGLANIPGVAALQLTVGQSALPILVTDEAYTARLKAAGLDAVTLLRTPLAAIEAVRESGDYGIPTITTIDETGDWLATLALPLESEFAGQKLTLSARIDLDSLAAVIRNHPFARRGEITVIDAAGRTVLESEPRDLGDRAIVDSALRLIEGNARAATVESYERSDGTPMLGAYAFPRTLPWVVITELGERNAYAVVGQMTRNLALWVLAGFCAAALAAGFFARRLTRPILRIGEVANRVGGGDFKTRVEGVRTNDEIGDLAERMNTMIRELGERLELMKFVSRGTVSAIRAADSSGISRSGARRPAAMMFSDIRGYTAFAETVDPEVVVEMLNSYLDTQTAIVESHGGDVDKFIADELVAVFLGEGMERRAVASALDIQEAMAGLLREHPEWDLHVGIGISAGEVVMGAMGARERMDFTVLGDPVNLASRLCDAAPPRSILVSEPVRIAVAGDPELVLEPLEPIRIKGKRELVPVFKALRAVRADRSEAPAIDRRAS